MPGRVFQWHWCRAVKSEPNAQFIIIMHPSFLSNVHKGQNNDQCLHKIISLLFYLSNIQIVHTIFIIKHQNFLRILRMHRDKNTGVPAQRPWSQRCSCPSRWSGRCVCAQPQPWPSTPADRPQTERRLRELTWGWRAGPSPRGPGLEAGRWRSPPGRKPGWTAAAAAPEAGCLMVASWKEGRCKGSNKHRDGEHVSEWQTGGKSEKYTFSGTKIAVTRLGFVCWLKMKTDKKSSWKILVILYWQRFCTNIVMCSSYSLT